MSLAYLDRHNLHTSPWTAMRDALLVQLWGQGYSAAEIADQMSNVSRCAVLGRVRRLKLPARKPREQPPKQARRTRQFVPKPPAPPPRPDPPPLPPGAPRMRRLTLVELKPTSCRWPIDEGTHGWLFCAADAAEGQIYCPHHFARAHVGKRELAVETPPNPNHPRTKVRGFHQRMARVREKGK